MKKLNTLTALILYCGIGALLWVFILRFFTSDIKLLSIPVMLYILFGYFLFIKGIMQKMRIAEKKIIYMIINKFKNNDHFKINMIVFSSLILALIISIIFKNCFLLWTWITGIILFFVYVFNNGNKK